MRPTSRQISIEDANRHNLIEAAQPMPVQLTLIGPVRIVDTTADTHRPDAPRLDALCLAA